MNWRKIVPLFCTFVLLSALLPLGALAALPRQQDILAKVEPLVTQELAAHGQTDYFIWMTEKADLTPAYAFETKLEKGRFVYETLVATAERTQKDLRAYLDRQGANYEAFYIANKILVRGGDYALLLSVAARPDVARVTANHPFQLQSPVEENPNPAHTLAVEPNITFLNVPQVWALGYSGQGTVLAGNDTGLDETHPAVARHYRGCLNPPTCSSWDHNYNWWDATNTYPSNPDDGFGHGTHTTGTMVGDDGGTNQIGMAPQAKTVHCKNMTDGGGGNDATFTTCFQWDLAPWDLNHANPRVDLAPDAINNSWGYGGGGAPQFEDEIAALQAAGIVVEASAGNEGESCSSLRSPGDYEQVLTTGSVQHLAPFPGTITGFSSRGPSSLYPNDYFPDIMAPGENVRSCVPGGGYEAWSGTSMAGPHATALIGLIWSANPALRGQVALTYQIIKDTAVPLTGQGGSNCGGDYTDGPNNDWGFGTIDALAAVQMARAIGGAGQLNGTVTDASTSLPIEGVFINAYRELGLSWDDTTDAFGFYSMTVAAGTFTVTADIFGYYPGLATGVVVPTDGVTVQDFALVPLPAYVISGTVTEAGTGNPLAAVVEVLNTPIAPVSTNPTTGYYSLTVPAGSYTLRASSAPLAPAYQNVIADHDQTVNFQLYGFCEVFSDTVENGNLGWTPGGSPDTWAITTESSHSPSHSWTDSPGGNYGDYADNYIASPILDLSDYAGVVLQFWQTYNTEATWDFCHVEYSNDGGVTWHEVAAYDGYAGWSQVQLSIPELDAQAQAQVRFHFTSDTSVTYDGWHVDDISFIAGGPACAPVAPVAGFESNSPILDGALAVFTNTTTGSEPITYLWAFGDGTTSSAVNPTHTYPAPGTYDVVLTATNAGGSDTVRHPFVVECVGVHNADFVWTPPDPAVGAVVSFDARAAGSSPIAYAWDLGDGTQDGGVAITHTYSAAGDPVVVLTATNACGGQVVSHTVHICDLVTEASFTWMPATPAAGEVVTFTGTASSADPLAYDWDFGDGSLGSGSTATHSYAQPGDYAVTMTATNDCGQWATSNLTVTVLEPCVDAQIVTHTAQISGCVVTFGAVLTGTPPFEYLWDLGAFGTSTETNPVVDFGASGTYAVTLQVYNCTAGQDTVSFDVTVTCAAQYRIYLPLVLKGHTP